MNIFKKTLNILDLRKYFFSYIYILSYIGTIVFSTISNILEPPYISPGESQHIEYPIYPFLILTIICIIFFCEFSYKILVIEIIFRNLLLEPFFEKFKKPFRYSKSDKLNKILTIVFWIFFMITLFATVWIFFFL